MWHWLKNLLGNKHFHQSANQVINNITPALQAATIIGGVNASLSIYDRLSKINNDAKTGSPVVENDETLFNDFISHLKDYDTRLLELTEEINILKNEKNVLEEQIFSIDKKEQESNKTIIELNQEIKILKIVTSNTNNKIKSLIIFNLITIIIIIGAIFYLFYDK